MYLYSWDTTGGGKKKVGPGVYYEGTARRGYFNCPKPLVKAIYRIVGVISAAQDMGCQIGAAGGGLAPPYLEEGWEKGLSVPPVMRIYGSLHEIRTDDPNPGLRLCPMAETRDQGLAGDFISRSPTLEHRYPTIVSVARSTTVIVSSSYLIFTCLLKLGIRTLRNGSPFWPEERR